MAGIRSVILQVMKVMKVKLIPQTLAVLGFTAYISKVYVAGEQDFWFQNINLVYHEAGHVLFYYFGSFMYILGGTIFEIMVPLSITIYFLWRKEYFGTFFAAWWLSTAFYSVGVYAADARSRVLPLITNDVNAHDWYNMLSRLDWLSYDHAIGQTFLWLSWITLAGASILFLTYAALTLLHEAQVLEKVGPKSKKLRKKK